MKRAIIIALLLLTSCGEHDRYARPARDGERVFYGDSITELCAPRLNRGYGGYESADILPEVQYYAERDGKAEYFILIGINDIANGNDSEYIYNMAKILSSINSKNVNLISILPTAHQSFNDKVLILNEQLKVLALQYGVKYLDKHSQIKPWHLEDGVHLTREGCEVLYGTH
ncbi:MAG: SGNH/GDSL hydrolase family protein [Candidatus Hodarchaeales archaeon]|jgi:lysophospholipase L1-like esterase